MKFKAFPKISSLSKIEMTITQKIHGTNAQIVIAEYPEKLEDALPWMLTAKELVHVDGKNYFIRAGSRTRWIYPGDDNFGFAAFVEANKEEIVRTLGVGQHFGEWAGPGINSGEGLTQKPFVLFDYWKFPQDRKLPPQTVVVPVLYQGAFDLKEIERVSEQLKTEGSRLAPGFMRPEGIVISVLGTRIKKVFDAEETQWRKPSEVKNKTTEIDVSHLLQPIRLEKLLSKDERYIRDFPKSLVDICSAYTSDLIEEAQIVGDKHQVRAVQKILAPQLFAFVKQAIKNSNSD